MQYIFQPSRKSAQHEQILATTSYVRWILLTYLLNQKYLLAVVVSPIGTARDVPDKGSLGSDPSSPGLL